MTSFHGVIPYLVSPLDENGEVKVAVLTKLCQDLLEKGVHGFAPLGSTGEFAYLSHKQKTGVVKTVVQAADKKVPVIAGVAATTITGAVNMAQEWEQIGCDGILATLESYFPLSEDEVYSFFSELAHAVSLPLVLYTNPSFQRTDLSIPVIKRLSKIENIRGIKDASTNTGRLQTIMNECGTDLEVFAASSHIPACVMLIGGKGWMAGPACLAPRQSVALYELCREKKWEEAMQLQAKLWQLNQAFNKFNLAACVKAGLQIQGYDVGIPLPPQSPLSSADKLELARLLQKIDSM